MRLLFHLSLIVIVFLAGIVFAQSNKVHISTDNQSLFWSENYPFETQEDRTLSSDSSPFNENNFALQNIASKIELITAKVFNALILILYEISRLFFTSLS